MKDIYIFFGDDADSLEKDVQNMIINAKVKGWLIKEYDMKAIIFDEIEPTNPSLFDEKYYYIFRNAHLLKDSQLGKLAKFNKLLGFKSILISTKKINKKSLKLKSDDISEKEYNLPKLLFKYLESLTPNNIKTSYYIFNQLKKESVPEVVLYMIFRHFRDLYIVKSSENTLNYPSWRKSKLALQAKKFELSMIKKILIDLSVIDTKIKRGEEEPWGAIELFMYKYIK